MTEPRVYQATDGRWIVIIDDIKSDYFISESEALEMSEKIQFAEKVIALSEILVDVIKELPSVEKIWALEDYLTNMTDTDITSIGKTKDEVAAFITFSQNFVKFLTGDDTLIPASYQDTLYNLLKGP